MQVVEGRHPSRSDMDEAAPEHPARVQRVCGHMSAANSTALQIADIGPDTADLTSGTIVRDASGAPTGLLLERA